MRPRPVALLKGVPPFVLGLAIVRGETLPVVHLGRLLRGDATDSVSRFVTLRLGSRRLALAVEGVLGVRDVNPDDLMGLPSLLGPESAQLVEAIGRLDAELLFVLSAMRIVPEPVWDVLCAGVVAS